MRKSITQDMAYRQSLMKYAEKYGVSRASRKYNKSRSYIYFWKARWDGTAESLACQSTKLQKEYDSQRRYCTPLTAVVLAVTAAVLPVLGMLPYATQDRLADIAQTFLHGLSPSHAVNYFSLVNLKGGFISIVLGALIYLLLIRKLLMGEKKSGAGNYLDRWPEKLDLLTLIYEPLLLKILPAVFGFCCRVLDFAADGIILFFRRTTHSQLREPEELPADYVLPYYLGKGMNSAARLGNRKDGSQDYRQLLARRRSLSREAWRMFQASASFSLMMFGIGMIVSVIYLLVV